MKKTMKTSYGLAFAMAAVFLSGCGERITTKADDERLAALSTAGLDAKARSRAEQRLTKILGKSNGTGALSAQFDTDAVNNGQPLGFTELLGRALERNPDIGAAAQAINRAEAERLNAILGYLPQVEITYNYSQVSQEVVETDNQVFELGEAEYPVTNLALEVRQPIFELSRIFGIQQANTARSVAEVEYLAAVQRTAFDTFDAYLVAARAQARISSIRRQASLIGQQITSERALNDTGLATDNTVNIYTAERSMISAREASEAAAYAQALSDLAFLSGTAVSDVAPLQVPAGLAGAERRTSVSEALAAAEENNPALLATAIGVVETELGRRAALAADFSPVIDAFARFEDEEREGSRFGGGSRTQDTTFGVRVSIPLFNAGGRGYSSTEAKVDVRDAALEYISTKRQIETEIASTLRRMGELSRSIQQYSSAVAANTRAVRTEEARVETGESVDVVLLGRQIAQAEAREQLDFQRAEHMRAWVRLQYLTGAELSTAGL